MADSEVLRVVIAMHAIRDGEHGYVSQTVRDFINATLDAHPDDAVNAVNTARKAKPNG